MAFQNTDIADVSVVIPTYNSSSTLSRALTSVASQTQKVREIIISDDASDENEIERLERIVSDLSSILPTTFILKNSENNGAAAARNIGWANSQGLFVAFLDSDDAWHSKKIETQYALMHKQNAEISAHLYVECDKMYPKRAKTIRYSFRNFLIRNRVSTPTVMVLRDIPERFTKEKRYSEDYLLWLQIANRTPFLFIQSELARGFKKAYGDAGLSANMENMFLGQVDTYRRIHQSGMISTISLGGLLLWSALRYVRRKVRVRMALFMSQ